MGKVADAGFSEGKAGLPAMRQQRSVPNPCGGQETSRPRRRGLPSSIAIRPAVAELELRRSLWRGGVLAGEATEGEVIAQALEVSGLGALAGVDRARGVLDSGNPDDSGELPWGFRVPS